MSKAVYSLLLLRVLIPAVETLCTVGPDASTYNAYLDQRPTGDAMELAGKVNAAMAALCRPKCPGLAMFRNTTASNAMLIKAGSELKLVYRPDFFTTVYDSYGDGGIVAILAHQVGHAIDATSSAPWIRKDWTLELRADAWTGCAFAKINLNSRDLKAGLNTLSKYPSPSHPNWPVRVPVLRLGYTQCSGDGAVFDKAL